VIYYGRLITEKDQLATLQMPILGIFGAEDQGIPLDSVREFEAALEELDKDAAIHVYEGAEHAFANPSGTRYNEEAAEDAWSKTLAFLAENLR
jgi:carboxymethylenebutenolidase